MGEPPLRGRYHAGKPLTHRTSKKNLIRTVAEQVAAFLLLSSFSQLAHVFRQTAIHRPRKKSSRPPLSTTPYLSLTGVAWNVRRVLAKTPSRRHFESKRTSKTGSTSKIGSRNGFVRFGNFCIFRSLSPHGVLNSGHKLTVTYYGEITIEPILNPEFDVDHDFEVKNGCFQSLFPRFRVISAYSTGRASHSDHFSGQVSMATILQDFYLFRRGFQLGVRDHLPDEG